MGTYRVLQLAEQMKRLEAFVFVSTGYSQSYQLDLEEKFYPTGYKIFDVIDKVQSDDEAALEKIQEQWVCAIGKNSKCSNFYDFKDNSAWVTPRPTQ